MKLQAKLLVVYGVVGALALGIGVYSFWTLQTIVAASQDVTQDELPRMQSIEVALISLSEAQAAADAALNVASFDHIDDVVSFEAALRGAILKFDMHTSAITWGSESEAFARSAGGINSREWDRSHLRGSLVVQAAPGEQVQHVGNASLQFAGFAKNIQKSVSSHKSTLRLKESGRIVESEKTEAAVRLFRTQAQSFASGTVSSLQSVVAVSHAQIAKDRVIIATIQKTQQTRIIAIVFFGTLVVLGTFMIFISRLVVRPIVALKETADAFGRGDFSQRVRTTTTIQDEIQALGVAFNTMADNISQSQNTLEQKVKERTVDLEKMNSLMIGRELKMVELKKELQALRDQKTKE